MNERSRLVFAVLEVYRIIKTLGSFIEKPENNYFVNIMKNLSYGSFHYNVCTTGQIQLIPVNLFISRCIFMYIHSDIFATEVDAGFEHN